MEKFRTRFNPFFLHLKSKPKLTFHAVLIIKAITLLEGALRDGWMPMGGLSESAARCRIVTPEGFWIPGFPRNAYPYASFGPLSIVLNRSAPFPPATSFWSSLPYCAQPSSPLVSSPGLVCHYASFNNTNLLWFVAKPYVTPSKRPLPRPSPLL